jgi:PAP2 superfamily
MWLQWGQAFVIAIVLAGFGLAARSARRREIVVAGAFARETALVLVLYGMWQYAIAHSTQVPGAIARARWIWHVERVLHLPSEVSMQHLVLPHPLVVQAANAYYALAHVNAFLIFLIWLFVRHRDQYPRVRNTLAIATGASLLIRLWAVAPPRMLGYLGFVDTGFRYHQSVYQQGSFGDVAAMPSVHVVWAVLIGVAVWRISESRWRWIGPGHAVLTVLAITVTANHWWADGIVAVTLLALAWLVQRWVPALASGVRTRLATPRARTAPAWEGATLTSAHAALATDAAPARD